MQKKIKKAPAKQIPLKAVYEQAAASHPQAQDPEVLPAGSPAAIAADSRERASGILGQVRQDIDNAELGRFFALRAGVGLIVVKELCAHGEFMPEALRMIPNRHPATLRRYINEARQFLEAKALMAHEVWLPLSQVGQRSGRLLGPGGGEDLPQPASDLAEWLAAKDEEKKKKPEAPGKKELTKRQKVEAATAHALGLAHQVSDWLSDGMWALILDDDLESVASALRAASDRLRADLRNRGRGAPKI